MFKTIKIPAIPREAVIWITALIILPFAYHIDGMSFCPFHNIGISFCPGCGLGRSIVYLYRLDFSGSFSAHPFGIPALLIILHRIFTLFNFSHYFSERNSHG